METLNIDQSYNYPDQKNLGWGWGGRLCHESTGTQALLISSLILSVSCSDCPFLFQTNVFPKLSIMNMY